MSLQGREACFLPLVLDELPDSLKEKAKIELCETEEAVRDGLQKMKKLIKEKSVLTCTDDNFLMMFLRSKKFNVSKAFEQLKSYSYQRHVWMNYYGFIFADKVMPAIHNNICGILPKRDQEGRAIIFFRACKYSPDICEPDNVLRALQLLIHFALKFPATQVSGVALISDAKVESLHTLQLAFRYVKVSLPSLHALPARFQSVNIINTNVFVRTCFAIVRHLIPSKLVGRVTFHGSNENALLEDFDASLLPTEFGGTMGSLENVPKDYYIKKVEEFIPILHASNHYFKRKDTVPFPDS
ncbi:Clavesin-1 like protein [Argiope bruennichi]|uniref:Clavesin-1 like protein n=1 Tax=Argiope bruennichi TaxID=94029 RepID=A0A8T0ETA8_ARGBR|nr:Clavesin-1 like protein [Argiope bruennichi]